MQLLKLLFVTSRPISWVNTAYPFAAGYVLSGGSLNAIFWIGTLFFLIPYNLLMYGVNDVFDYESDIRNPRKGGIEGAVTPKKYHKAILTACAISCLPLILALIGLGTMTTNLTLVVVLFFVIAYSVKGLRFKEVPVLDSITSSMHFTGPLLYALALNGFSAAFWPYITAFFLWGLASHAFGAVQDINPDRQGNIHSIATVFGARATVYFALTLYIISAVLVGLQGGLSLVVALAGLSYAANVAPYIAITDSNSALARAGWRRFIWVNYAVGAVVTICLILSLQ